MTATSSHITGVRAISIPVDDQQAALRFYVDTLGFTVLRDDGKAFLGSRPATPARPVQLVGVTGRRG